MAKQKLSILYILSVLILECFYLLPICKLVVDIPMTSYCSFLFSIIFFSTDVKKNVIFNTFLYAIPFLLLSFIVSYEMNFWKGFLHPTLLTWYAVFPAFLSYDLLKRNNKIEIIFSMVVSIILMLYVGFNTIGELQFNELLLRQMTNGADNDDFSVLMLYNNIGGFGYIYSVGVIFIAFISLILYGKLKIYLNILCVCITGVFAYLILNAQFTTLLLLVIFSILVVLFLHSSKAVRVLLIISIPCLIMLLPFFFNWMISLYGDSVIGEHLQSFYDAIWINNNMEDVAGLRSQYMSEAIAEGIKSPIWGQCVAGTRAGLVMLHSHSTVLATFVSTGIIGMYFRYKSILFASNQTITRLANKQWQKAYLPVQLYFVLLSLLNPLDQGGEVPWIVFFVIPVLFYSSSFNNSCN